MDQRFAQPVEFGMATGPLNFETKTRKRRKLQTLDWSGCRSLVTARIFGRGDNKRRKDIFLERTLLNAKPLFLCRHNRINSRLLQGFGKGAEIDIEPPDFGSRTVDDRLETDSVVTSTENLKKVKWEVSGHCKRQVHS